MSTKTLKLPLSLQREIDKESHPNQRRPQYTSRKESRKNERAEQKNKKAAYFSNARKRPAEKEHVDTPDRKKIRISESFDIKYNPAKPSTKQRINSVHSVPFKPPTKSTKLTALAPLPKRSPVKPRTPADAEDAYIALLESKLGIGGKGKSYAEEDDGLDGLLNWADSLRENKPSVILSDNDEEELNEEESSATSEEGQSFEEDESSDPDDSDEEWNGIAGENIEQPPNPTKVESLKIHIQDPGAYVPPHLRNASRQPENNEEIQKLTRQLKGLLNRMSEQNIATILSSIEEVYREYRRNDVTTTLTNLIINGICSHSSLLDSYVVLHAALVSSMHKAIGVEFAAHFVQSVINAYERQYSSLSNPLETTTESENVGKEASNLLVLISELYNFQVISSVLVFDIVRVLLEGDLTEFKVELLLKVARNSGQQLRQDDPSVLKDIIQIVQGKLSSADDAVSSRTRFMIETLTNLKNNKLKRNATQNQGGAAVERMKKFLSGLSKTKHVLTHEPLRVSLEDLHSAKTKGKWWLVGAAWNGDPLVDNQEEFAKSSAKDQVDVSDESTDLIKLARTQGMNSEIRRGIFVVLMSSDDYVDACERLGQLNLTEVQQREIIRVLLHCCGNERTYNPYYALVCQQLCRSSHSYRITLQYSLWDFLRDLGETNVGGAAVIKSNKDDDKFDNDSQTVSDIRLRNVAKAYAWWIAKESLTLLILKPVDFTMLRPQSRLFFKEFFSHIFANSQRSVPLAVSDLMGKNLGVNFTRNRNAIEEIFIKSSKIRALAMGLVYFLSETFEGNDEGNDEGLKDDEDFSEFVRWAVGVAKDTLRTAIDLML